MLKKTSARDIISRLSERLPSEAQAILNSQFIDKEAAGFILGGDYGAFLNRRAKLIVEAAESLCGG